MPRQMKRHRAINGASKKREQESLLEQLSAPLKDFVTDFKEHGKSVLEKVRQDNPLNEATNAASLEAISRTLAANCCNPLVLMKLR